MMHTSGKIGIVISLTLILTFPVTVVSGAKPSPKTMVTTEQSETLRNNSRGVKCSASMAQGSLECVGKNRESRQRGFH